MYIFLYFTIIFFLIYLTKLGTNRVGISWRNTSKGSRWQVWYTTSGHWFRQ